MSTKAHSNGKDELLEGDINEETPLLAGQAIVQTTDPAVAESLRSNTAKDESLPKTQILLLCYARMIEPIVFFSIFPFINQMIKKNGQLDDADVGFYSGLIESLFSLTQMFVMIGWGRVADRYGRKPVLVVSIAGVAVTAAAFGFSKNIWQMIVLRCLAGIFAGSTVTIRTMISEHSTAKTQARAFSWFAFTANVGMFLGPLLGGALADPAKQYGGFFETVPFFKSFPYALPTVVTGILGSTAALTSAVFLEETLDKSKDKSGKDQAPQSIGQILKSPGVKMVLYLYGHVMLLGLAYTAIVPVFWFYPVEIGGFGFSELLISLFMAGTGLAQAIWLLIIFPPLQHRFGTGGVMRGCANAYPFFFPIAPFLNWLLREGSDGARISFWVIAPISLVLGVGVSMSFTAIQLALNDVSPSPQTLGTLNALALSLVSGIRAFSPVLFTSIFAWSVKYQILDGYLVWLIMTILAAGFTIATRWLPKNAEGKTGPTREEESDP